MLRRLVVWLAKACAHSNVEVVGNSYYCNDCSSFLDWGR